MLFFFFQAEDGIRDRNVTGVQTCALPIYKKEMIQVFVNFIRNHKVAAGVLAFLRIYIGYEWFTSGIGKVTGGFDASGFIEGAIAQAGGDNPAVQGWW